jgi:hypothetical protein
MQKFGGGFHPEMARRVYVPAPPASSATVTVGQRAQAEGV